MYLLPAIDLLEGKVVRLAKGDYNQVTVYNDDPAAQAYKFEEAGATWVHVVDLDGARAGKQQNYKFIERIAAKTLLNIEVGGGIRDLATIQRLYDAGVSRIVLGTSLVTDTEFVDEAIAKHRNILAAGIDAKEGQVAIAGWREGAGVPAEELVKQVGQAGFRHLIYTDISKDGMQTGIDAAAYVAMAELFGNPVIASGGVAGIEDIDRLGQSAAAIEGVIAGRAIYESSLDVHEAVVACAKWTRKVEAKLVVQGQCGGCSC